MRHKSSNSFRSNIHEAISILFSNDPKLLRIVLPDPTGEFERPIESEVDSCGGVSYVENLQLRLCLDLWDGTGGAFLGEALGALSDAQFECLLLALERVRFPN